MVSVLVDDEEVAVDVDGDVVLVVLVVGVLRLG